ncbi:aminotransferase-like domain-containing protein [Aureliella helgolandensis]|uniref:2-aminoadipate transaminase n=1 Tax=Aureliella helgolandensis TaxID=2527968 RepID=A0A518G3Y7_9BACT|nr:PLP-dependent aminotransferase family protein [Aureliella helgolandensis]QDV23270.1 2-aminoadipate transaminase [Aureliella helgolandensis]
MGHTVSEPNRTSTLSRRAGMSSGQPIGRLMALALKHPNLVSLAAGFVDNDTLPCETTAAALRRLADQPELLRKALQYDMTAGSGILRANIAEWNYRRFPAGRPDPERMIVTAGSNQFLHLVAEALLDPGDIVLAAAPTYFVFMGTLKGVDARIVGVSSDEFGMSIDALQEQLQRIAAAGDAHRVKLIYTVTDFDNPAGSTLSLERREQLLEVVRRWRAEQGPIHLLSDCAYQELRYEGEDLPPLLALADDASEFVIEAGTFSKSYSPGIRVGWGVVPESLAPTLLEMKSNIDFGSPHFAQVLMNDVLTSGEIDSHLPVIRAGYRVKLDAMLDALDAELGETPDVVWHKPAGGLYVWLTLPEHIDASEGSPLWRCAMEQGVLYVPGYYCYPTEGEPIALNTIRLSFGVQNPAGIRLGIERLAAAIRQVAQTG